MSRQKKRAGTSGGASHVFQKDANLQASQSNAADLKGPCGLQRIKLEPDVP